MDLLGANNRSSNSFVDIYGASTKIIALFPLLFLVGCSQAKTAVVASPAALEEAMYQVSYDSKGLATISPKAMGEGSHITYLMMSKYGRINVDGTEVKGVDVDEKFLENCIVYKSEPGAALPAANLVSSELHGVTFRGWFQYNDNVYPDKLEVVPTATEQKVFAIFDGPTGGGGSGGGGGGGSGGGGGGTVTTGFGILVGNTPVQATYKGTNMDGKEEYLASRVSVNAGDVFSLYDFSNGATWAVSPNAWSFGDTQGTGTFWKEYIRMGTTSYTALKSFTADFYIQLQYQNDTLYIELK